MSKSTEAEGNTLSIIIPTLNEAHTIAATLDVVAQVRGHVEVIVVDGGSTDGTLEIMRELDVRVITSERGRGVFGKSIEALKRLNGVGYGVEDSNLVLNLVYNPVGAFLPPAQSSIETDFKRELMLRHDVSFNHLYTITNMPIKRFLDYLRRTGNEGRYMRKLVEAFNPAAIEGLMCRNLVSVDWTGRLYDCDFNQMLELGVAPEVAQNISEFDPAEFAGRRIMTGPHCFGCTAGAGSSCGGSLTKS